MSNQVSQTALGSVNAALVSLNGDHSVSRFCFKFCKFLSNWKWLLFLMKHGANKAVWDHGSIRQARSKKETFQEVCCRPNAPDAYNCYFVSDAAKVMPVKDSVDALIRSDPKVLGMDLYSFASIPEPIHLEHKVDYLTMLAEERKLSVSMSIGRAYEANYVDFNVQFLSTSANNLNGEMAITLLKEPGVGVGVGVGVTREFFQIDQKCAFRPESTGNLQVRSVSAQPAPHVAGLHRVHSPDPQTRNRVRNATTVPVLNEADRHGVVVLLSCSPCLLLSTRRDVVHFASHRERYTSANNFLTEKSLVSLQAMDTFKV